MLELNSVWSALSWTKLLWKLSSSSTSVEIELKSNFNSICWSSVQFLEDELNFLQVQFFCWSWGKFVEVPFNLQWQLRKIHLHAAILLDFESTPLIEFHKHLLQTVVPRFIHRIRCSLTFQRTFHLAFLSSSCFDWCIFFGCFSRAPCQEETSVQAWIDSCIQDEDKLYLCVSSPTIKDKPVHIRPWRLTDADYVLDASMLLDPRKTVFVGGVPRPLKASE
jgi:hypothetical protein